MRFLFLKVLVKVWWLVSFGWLRRKKVLFPIAEVVKLQSERDGRLERVLEEADPEELYYAVSMIFLETSFKEVTALLKDSNLRSPILNSNIDILALEFALYYLTRVQLTIDVKIEEHLDGWMFENELDYGSEDELFEAAEEHREELDKKYLVPIKSAVFFLEALYSQYYQSDMVEMHIRDATKAYWNILFNKDSAPHELFLLRFKSCLGMREFPLSKERVREANKPAIELDLSLSAFVMISEKEMFPVLYKVLDTLFEKFLGNKFPYYS